jgi:hypothetical protein
MRGIIGGSLALWRDEPDAIADLILAIEAEARAEVTDDMTTAYMVGFENGKTYKDDPAEARAPLDEPPRIVTLAWDATAEDVARIRRDWEAAAEARAEGLDVERLARALEAAMSGQHVIPPALRSEFGLPPIWEPLAERLAREYAALEEPTP